MKTALFQSCGHCWVFQICWYIECKTLTASCFRIWNSSTGILSSLLAWLIVILPNSVQFNHSVMSYSFRPHGLQHARPPCPLPTTGAYSNSCPLSWWCHPTISSSVIPFSSCLQSFQHQNLFKWVSSSHPKHWSFSFIISPSNEYSGLISFRMDWLNLLAVQGTLKSLLQHHSSKASILWRSTFFIVQLSHPYTTIGKNTALT